MTKQEMQARMDAATEASRSDIEAVLAEVNGDSFADYWAGSASQSYCDSIERGDFVVRELS
jgi:hypothetical protein